MTGAPLSPIHQIPNESNCRPAETPDRMDDNAPDRRRDFITVASAADGKLMTKVFFVDRDGREQTRSYDKGYLFTFSTPAVTCLDELARVLDGLDQHSC